MQRALKKMMNRTSIHCRSTSLLPRRARVSLARLTSYINLAVMATPPDAESLESRISEYFKLVLSSQCSVETPDTHNLLSVSCSR